MEVHEEISEATLELAKKRTADLRAQVAQAEIELQEAKTQLDRIRSGKPRFSVEGNEAPSKVHMEPPSKICRQLKTLSI
ncbi:unnamed protein product [Lactuca virosa]|uniref:Uncharacterized protein n=1 Tax=Lactuca virosa TaxID=75947 RepID=A0AAU9PPG1_9ASTR|nr:unnamed protein product [Lactuca virosa]